VIPRFIGDCLGLKDKRAVTTQHVTAYRIPAQRLRDLNPKLFSIRLGNFTYVKNVRPDLREDDLLVGG